MKKAKSILGMLILSACLVGNSFAGASGIGTGAISFFDSLINAIVGFATRDDCEGRICTDCRPQSEGGGTCRPTQ